MHRSLSCRPVGRVVGLWRYPVKSMGAEKLADVDVSWHGLAGDRRWAFVRNGVEQSGFPWLTLRERGDLSHYLPSFLEPAHPDKSPTVVRTPTGTVFEVTDPALGSELSPGGARVIRQDRGIFDTFPLSLITTQTIARLGESVGAPLEVQRFRPNFLVEAEGDSPFPEDAWVGCILRLGGPGGSRRLRSHCRLDRAEGRGLRPAGPREVPDCPSLLPCCRGRRTRRPRGRGIGAKARTRRSEGPGTRHGTCGKGVGRRGEREESPDKRPGGRPQRSGRFPHRRGLRASCRARRTRGVGRRGKGVGG